MKRQLILSDNKTIRDFLPGGSDETFLLSLSLSLSLNNKNSLQFVCNEVDKDEK